MTFENGSLPLHVVQIHYSTHYTRIQGAGFIHTYFNKILARPSALLLGFNTYDLITPHNSSVAFRSVPDCEWLKKERQKGLVIDVGRDA
jgi:hypothetical protein